MRIAHVSDCYLPRLGGIEVQVHDLAARQLAAGHEVEVITPTAAGSAGPDDVTVHRVGRGVHRAVGGGFDVVHVHLSMFSPFGLDVLRELAAGRLPVAVTMHSLWGNWEPAGRLRVLSVMRLCRRKRPFPLLRMVGGAELTLVGAGPTESLVRRRVADAALPVTMTGALSRPAIRELMGAHDVYVAPAPLESFGIAAIEARSAGLPVIARAGSGLAGVIRHGVDGLLVDSDAAMAEALVALRCDAGLLDRLRRGASSPPDLGWTRTLDGYDRLYADAVSVSDRRPALVAV